MSKLKELIIRRIQAEGPMSIAEYMTVCLTHPDHGYYTTRDPFGRHGDFITAPEISQMFGEMLGLAYAQYWLDLGAPPTFSLVELGPGRGTLMADMLRATRSVPGFHAAARLYLFEASPVLKKSQEQLLGEYGPTWIEDLSAMGDAPVFLVANEFFDALPIRQFVRAENGWSERVVGLNEQCEPVFGQTTATMLAQLDEKLESTNPGDMVEVSAGQTALASEIGEIIAEQQGLAVIVDYGDWGNTGNTFQAVRAHEQVDPLMTPGNADLTAHVDFEALARASSVGGNLVNFATQGAFLEALGINLRARQLAENMSGEQLNEHFAAHRRLTHADEMGTLFKVLAITASDAPMPAGFANDTGNTDR